MPAYEIPLSAQPQRFSITLAGVSYRMTVQWNAPMQCWVFDLADGNGVGILSGVPIVTGLDLLSPFEYLGLNGQLIAQTDGDLTAVPTFANLGAAGHLYWVTS